MMLHSTERIHAAARAMLADAPVKNAGVTVMLRLFARAATSFAPFVFHANVGIAELLLRRDRPEHLARNTDRRRAILSATVNTPSGSLFNPNGALFFESE